MSKSNRIRLQKVAKTQEKTDEILEFSLTGLRVLKAQQSGELMALDEPLIKFLVAHGWQEQDLREGKQLGWQYNAVRNSLFSGWQGTALFDGIIDDV